MAYGKAEPDRTAQRQSRSFWLIYLGQYWPSKGAGSSAYDRRIDAQVRFSF
jgi:hypothetical protein